MSQTNITARRIARTTPTVAWPLLLCVAAAPLAGAEAATSIKPAGVSNSGHWSSFLPFMAEEATKRGYELPLPFGVSASRLTRGPLIRGTLRLALRAVISRHWECFAEYGFNLDDVHVFATGLTFRF